MGAAVIQVTAADADAGSNAEISYHLSGSDVEKFDIDSASGEVTVAQPLDYETVTQPYILTVIAQDNGENEVLIACVFNLLFCFILCSIVLSCIKLLIFSVQEKLLQ